MTVSLDELTDTLEWLNRREIFDHDSEDRLAEADERVARWLDHLADLNETGRGEILRDLTVTQIDNLLVYAWRVGREPFKDEVEFDAVHAAQVHRLLAERLELLSRAHIERIGSSGPDAKADLDETIEWMAANNEGSRPYSLSPPALVSFPDRWEERTAAFVELLFAGSHDTRKAVVTRLSERGIHRLLGLYSENMIERTDFTGDCRLLVPAARAMALAAYGTPEDQDFTFFLHILMRNASRQHGCDLETVLNDVARELPEVSGESAQSVPRIMRVYARQNQSNHGIVGWLRDRFSRGP